MNRFEVGILVVLAACALSGCSTDPPKVDCERHLTAINEGRALAPSVATPTPAAAGARPTRPLQKAPPHGR